MASKVSMSHSRVEVIERSVCVALSVSSDDIKGRSKKRSISDARKILFALIRKKTGIPFTSIGKRYNRDHSTVMVSIDSYEELNETDTRFRKKVRDVISLFKNKGIS